MFITIGLVLYAKEIKLDYSYILCTLSSFMVCVCVCVCVCAVLCCVQLCVLYGCACHGWMDVCVYGWMDGCMHGWMFVYVCMYAMDGWMDAWMARSLLHNRAHHCAVCSNTYKQSICTRMLMCDCVCCVSQYFMGVVFLFMDSPDYGTVKHAIGKPAHTASTATHTHTQHSHVSHQQLTRIPSAATHTRHV